MDREDRDIREDIAEIRANLEQLRRHFEKISNDHEHRLRFLERWAWALPPTVIAATLSAVAALISALR